MNTKEKQFECHICNKKYLTLSSRSNHINNKHSDIKNKDEKHHCNFCNKSYTNITSKYKHEKKCNASSVINSHNNSKSNNNHSFNKNIYNITINQFSKENLGVLTMNDIKEIYNNNVDIIIKFIETFNFNEKYVENHNILNTNIKSEYVTVVGDSNKKTLITKNECFDLLLYNTIKNLETILKSIKNIYITNEKYIQLQKIIDATNMFYFGFDSKKNQAAYKKKVNAITYNNKETILESWKKYCKFDDSDDTSSDNSKSDSDSDSESDDKHIDGFYTNKFDDEQTFGEFLAKKL